MSRPLDRWRGRWRVALRIARRDARRHRGRTALVSVMIALPVLAGSGLATLAASSVMTDETFVATTLGDDLQATIGASTGVPIQQSTTRADGWGSSPDGTPRSWTPEEFEAELSARLPDGSALVRGFSSTVRVSPLGAEQLRLGALTQTDLAVPEVASVFPLIDGTLPTGADEVALGGQLARTLDLSTGDALTLELPPTGRTGTRPLGEFTVSGLLDDSPGGTAVLLDTSAPVPLPEAIGGGLGQGSADSYRWYVTGTEPVSWAHVEAVNALGSPVVSRSVVLGPPPPALVSPHPGLSPSFAAFVGAVALVGLLQAVLMIGPAFAVGSRRSARSLALLAASGGEPRVLRDVTLAGGVVIGAGASGVATLVGAGTVLLLGLTGIVPLPNLVVPWASMVGIMLVGTLIAVASAWLPARRAARADVVAVLAGRRGDLPPRRRVPVVGLVVAALGVVGAVLGALRGEALWLAAGVGTAEIGVVLACGGIVALLGRLARHLPVAARFALRDAARQRSRTAPAMAAVIVAVAGAVGAMIFTGAQAEQERLSELPLGSPGVVVAAGSWNDPLVSVESAATITTAMDEHLDLVGPVHEVAGIPLTPDGTGTTLGVDPPGSARGGQTWATRNGTIWGPVVDDGTLVGLLAIPDPEVARAALADGKVVVAERDLWPDGAVHLTVTRWENGVEVGEPETVVVPGAGVGGPLGNAAALPLVPEDVLDDLGIAHRLVGLVAQASGRPTRAEMDTLAASLMETIPVNAPDGGIALGAAEERLPFDGARSALVIALVAGTIALAATWIATALAAVESRPDLATLAAVGAPPRLRRLVAGAQAGSIAIVGVVLGTGMGLLLGSALVLYMRYQWELPDPRWMIEVPWLPVAGLAVGLPLLAVGAAVLATRSGLSLTRRLDV